MKKRIDEVKAYDIFLQKQIDKKNFAKIYRTFNEKEENVSGFILSMSKDFLLLQVVTDFMFDGYAIIRKDQFDYLQHQRFEIKQKKILKAEGLFDKEYGIERVINLNGWKEIFSDLKKMDYHVIVECEAKVEPDFIIGPIKRLTKDKASIKYYDPAGKLEEGVTSVKYSEITIVKFGDRYSTVFRRYLTQSTATR